LTRPLRQKEILDKVVPVFQSLSAALAEVSSRNSARELVALHDYFARTIEC
jgi:hypothetical protein